jgi:hypothetical protein
MIAFYLGQVAGQTDWSAGQRESGSEGVPVGPLAIVLIAIAIALIVFAWRHYHAR